MRNRPAKAAPIMLNITLTLIPNQMGIQRRESNQVSSSFCRCRLRILLSTRTARERQNDPTVAMTMIVLQLLRLNLIVNQDSPESSNCASNRAVSPVEKRDGSVGGWGASAFFFSWSVFWMRGIVK